MVEFVITNCSKIAPMLRVQRKDKAGSRGTYLELRDLKQDGSVTMQADTGNRIKLWFIGSDEKLMPGTKPAKLTISQAENNEFRKLGINVNYDADSHTPRILHSASNTQRI